MIDVIMTQLTSHMILFNLYNSSPQQNVIL